MSDYTYSPKQRKQLQDMARFLFMLAMALLAGWVLSGCSTFKGSAPRTCVPDAASYQHAAIVQDGLDAHVWSRLLFVVRDGDSHCFLIFKTKAGNYYAWDKRGSTRLWSIKTDKQAKNAKTVAKAIHPMISYAEYEKQKVGGK